MINSEANAGLNSRLCQVPNSTIMTSTPVEETCESTSSFLPQAVAALHLNQSASRENTKDSSAGGNSASDSGYVSQSPTPLDATTPAKYGSPEIVQSVLRNALPEQGRRNLFSGRAKTPLLKVFNKPVSTPARHRFEDLNELYGKKLVAYLRDSKIDTGTIRNLSIKLKLVGQEEATAKPCVVVLCDGVSAKRVKQFFDDKDVKAQYQPRTPSIDTPHFEIKVCASPPRMIALVAEVYGAQAGYTSDYPAVLGTPYKVFHTDGDHFGTIGGLVMVKFSGFVPEIYGLSAGHVIPQDQFKGLYESIEDLGAYAGDIKDIAIASGNDDNIDLDIVDQEYPFDFDMNLDLDPQSTEGGNGLDQSLNLGESPDISWLSIGNVVRMSHSNLTSDVRNLDWSLIKFHDLLDYDPEILDSLIIEVDPSSQWSTGPVCAFETDLYDDKEVEVFSGKSGRKKGLLSRTMSRIWLWPGVDFVRTYNLTLLDGTALQDGDCGCWVMDIDSAEVFGHVIASDSFGEAYVVPLSDTFEDIVTKLAANSVQIPSVKDILDWHLQREIPTTKDILDWHLRRDSSSDLIATQSKHEATSALFADSGYSSTGATPIVLPNSPLRIRDGIISSFLHESTKAQDHDSTEETILPTSPAEATKEVEGTSILMPVDQEGQADPGPTDLPTANATTEVSIGSLESPKE